jgi:nitrate reductase gamma subunit
MICWPYIVRASATLRFPVAISGGTFLMLFPLIIGRAEPNYVRLTGEQPPDWFAHWLLVTAIAFGLAALAYAVRLRRGSAGAAPTVARAS